MGKKRFVILHTLMGLDIGGAETHVVELSKMLKERGHTVIVASSGGVYEETLKQAGVIVENVPFHSKRPDLVLKSMIKLRGIVKKYHVDIVHAHARIPGFICSLVHLVQPFDFVTTVHGTFKVNPLLRHISKWGDQTIVVSEDIKKYMLDNYKVSEESLHKTINGINLETFKPREADHVKANRPTLLHVSRLEETTSMCASLLIRYAIKHPEIDLNIVGGGSELKRLQQESINQETGQPYSNIQLIGQSTSVPEYLEKADIFIGISRAALEAMCYNIPIILAGDYGYMGIIQKEMLSEAVYNNFTARVNQKTTYEKIEKDIDNLLLSKQEPDTSWERAYIMEYYSVERMVSDYEKVYQNI